MNGRLIELMNSLNHKDRCTAEYVQTKQRRDKLSNMICLYEADTLGFVPDCPIDLLKRQLKAMDEYLRVLEARSEIEGFPLTIDDEHEISGEFHGVPIQTLKVPDDYVIVVKYKVGGDMNIHQLGECLMDVEAQFPNNKVLCVPEETSLSAMSNEVMLDTLKSTEKHLHDMISELC